MTDSLDRYCARHNLQLLRQLGAGKDGTVFQTSRLSAVKAHEREESYLCDERRESRLANVTPFAGIALPLGAASSAAWNLGLHYSTYFARITVALRHC